jgi:5-oxoprolinase (ATP-hydrolysing) subunit A
MSGTFDINCDMGEGFGNWRLGDDGAVMPLISTANLACGFHAGDPLTMMNTVAMAKEVGVSIGAHPGLPDLLGFGRRIISVSPRDLTSYIIYQVGALKGFLAAAGVPLNHVKPHGALFYVLRDRALADAAVDAIIAVAPGSAIYWAGPGDRELFARRAAARGIRVCAEAYPDLDYTDDGSLLVEREKRQVSPELVYDRVVEIISNKTLTTRTGKRLPMDVDSVCVHGDSPNALDILAAARRAIEDCGLGVACATEQLQGTK